jgi:thioredoxin-related protein
MKAARYLVLIFSLFTTQNLRAQNELSPALPTATQVLNRASQSAAVENKKILLMFHASWCGWCRKMDSSLTDLSCKKFFDDNFVVAHITVKESKGKESLENAGGLEMMEKYNGKDMGLPYWVILDKDATLLFDSKIKIPGPNGKKIETIIGCPATATEVDRFIEILKKTSSLTGPQLEIIAKRFRQNESK